ncbi:MAG: hypothetical protein WBE58_15745 [Verrucomicrobiales bacterium]|nr:hypothetical protein [Verrucomicrobiales bacterium]
MLYFLTVLATLVLSLLTQEFIPPVKWAYLARILIVHVTFYCAAVTVPYPLMLVMAFATGFAWDALHHVPVENSSGNPELAFGLTILIFLVFGSLIQGVRPLFRRGRWELPVILIGFCIFGGLCLEHLLISFHRGSLELSGKLWFKQLFTSLFSMLAAPIMLLWYTLLAKWTGYRIRLEGITRRYRYGDAY